MRDFVPPSGYCYPNRMGRIYLIAMEEIMGRKGLQALLHLCNMSDYAREYPPDDLDKAFDFAHIANLNQGLEAVYGERVARSYILRGGRVIFARGLSQFGALAGVGDLAFKVLPLQVKLRIGLFAIARIFNEFSDQTSYVEETDDSFHYCIERCSMCWQRQHAYPLGHTAVGILQQALRWISGGLDFRIREEACICMGDKQGVFCIDKEPIR